MKSTYFSVIYIILNNLFIYLFKFKRARFNYIIQINIINKHTNKNTKILIKIEKKKLIKYNTLVYIVNT